MVSPSDADASLVAHVIQLAFAPVFLLTGVGSLLGVMTGRLARVIDRARSVETSWSSLEPAEQSVARRELRSFAERAHLSSWAINCCTSSALFTCLVIAMLFVDAFLGTELRWFVGGLFVLAMLALVLGLVCFLREVYIATHTLRIGPPVES